MGLMACENNTKEIPNSEIYINMPEDGYEVKVNDTIDISPKITYDINTTYSWVLDGSLISTEKDLRLIPTELNKYAYLFSINNSRGIASINISVQSMYKTDFEEIVLEEDTFWTNTENYTSFISDQIQFESTGNYESDEWTGFTYSNLTGSNSDNDYEKYSSYDDPDEYDSDIFGVMLLDAYQHPITLTTKDGEDHLFKSISINNAYYVVDAISNGNNGSKKFGGETGTDTDWLKLTITGINKNGTTRGNVEIMLADYTSGSNRYNTILKEWTAYDLQNIGKVSRLEFVLSSSDSEGGKINTPPFVCFDEVKIIE
ncbi:hypothetical protein JCM21142_52152 [Saccharicrinis fermentans DSM 9555 = JCM 21142]|uniref:Bacteroidetes PKD-like domain-containing protein n=2 Tax=Saccharicrinis fermentans TaxID=982 RepID=W7YGA9_9BACT|nr:hypothetical protein JCM21142_52152 [Saccharicrinis fermentans DSM 9555 = JCM 21142]